MIDSQFSQKFHPIKTMNPFQKLKLTIDRIGLEYIPSNDNQTITGQTVYKYPPSQQLQEQDEHVPYFKTQGYNQQSFKKHSAQFRIDQIQELKTVFENQQKNLINQINALNIKLKEFQMKLQVKSSQNQRLKDQVESRVRENSQLRAYILEIQQKNARKLSQSGVQDRQRKLKEQIDRINITVMDLAKQLNIQKSNRKNLQKQLQQSRIDHKDLQKTLISQKNSLKQSISLFEQELEKRAELLQHSIKSSRDEKVAHKAQIAGLKDKFENKIELLQSQINNSKSQIYGLKNEITELKLLNKNLNKEKDALIHSNYEFSQKLEVSESQVKKLTSSIKQLSENIQELKLQILYYQQQLQEERSNTKVKVVQVRDQGLEMELAMYKKQCKQLLREKSILETVRKQRSDYTIVSENQITLSRSE